MSARDELAEIIQDCGEYIPGSHADDYVNPNKAADAILAAGYTKHRTITTIDELDALPTDSTVRSEQGGIWVKAASGKDGGWIEPGAQWWHWPTDIALPATVLYEPTA